MLSLKNVKKSYDGTPVLKGISLDIEDGEIVSILGPSGCGKTTLLNLILGIIEADEGQILFNGKDLTNVPMEKRGFNIVFQDYAGGGGRPDPAPGTGGASEQAERSALRRTETESRPGKDHGDEAEDPAPG